MVATIAIVGTSIAYGFASFFARQLTDAGISATSVTFFRFAITAVTLAPFLPVQADSHPRQRRAG